MLPEFPFLDICVAELPVLLRLVDALQKTLSLLLSAGQAKLRLSSPNWLKYPQMHLHVAALAALT
jgi:hypothetical protein